MHVPAASFIKLQQTGQGGEFMKSPLRAHSYSKLYKLFDLEVEAEAKPALWVVMLRQADEDSQRVEEYSSSSILYLGEGYDKTFQWTLVKCLLVSCVVVGGAERKSRNK